MLGTASDDGLPIPPGKLTYKWSQYSGPGTVYFSTTSSRATVATFSGAGTYVLKLKAFDGILSTRDYVTVTVRH